MKTLLVFTITLFTFGSVLAGPKYTNCTVYISSACTNSVITWVEVTPTGSDLYRSEDKDEKEYRYFGALFESGSQPIMERDEAWTKGVNRTQKLKKKYRNKCDNEVKVEIYQTNGVC